MPTAPSNHQSNGSLTIPRSSTDGGSTSTLTPNTGQNSLAPSWAASEATVDADADRDTQVSAHSTAARSANRKFG